MTDAEVYEVLQEAFNSVFQRRDITVTSRLAAPDVIGWDTWFSADIDTLMSPWAITAPDI